jgi:hypothetical protein
MFPTACPVLLLLLLLLLLLPSCSAVVCDFSWTVANMRDASLGFTAPIL